MKIVDGETTHEIDESIVADILSSVCHRWGVRVESPLVTTLEPLLEILIEETARALFEEGFCAFEWHRRPFEPHGVGDVCTFCELPEAQHERVSCCPQLDESE